MSLRGSPSVVAERKEAARVRKPRRRGRRRSALSYGIEHFLFRAALLFLRLLPSAVGRAATRAAARFFLALARSRRRILLRNLARAFPQKPAAELATIARASVDSLAESLFDYLELSNRPREELLERVRIVGFENLEEARRRGHGVFLLSAHFGSWELSALAVGLLGEPIVSLVRPLDNPRLDAALSARRTRFGNRLIVKKEAARELLRAMRGNETVAILVDQNVVSREALFVPFFGRPAATNPSLALLQLKTRAAVVPVFTYPEGNGRYRIEIEAPVLPEEFESEEANRTERVRRATARYMEITEAAVRRQPSAWLWLHDRWRTRPPGE